jgi:ribosomal protein S27E
MAMHKCPGQDQRFWKPEDVFEVNCPACGSTMEFFKDDPALKCPSCGQTMANPKIDRGCLEWCRYAEECSALPSEKDGRDLRAALIDEMKAVFGTDEKRINHALAVLNYAEQIQVAEDGNLLIVRAAAILHDIGIHEAERKYGSNAGKYQEIEGPPIAEGILRRYRLSDATIDHVCRIIANHHSAKDIDTLEFRVIWDADWLVNFPEIFGAKPQSRKQAAVARVFKTDKGRQLAEALFLRDSPI